MPECDHCGESFDSESSYLRHLESEHGDELGRLEQRRVDELESDRSVDVGAILIALIVVGGFLVAGYVAVISGGFSGEDGPHGQTHQHGTLALLVDGEPVDFGQSHFIEQDTHFHFHGGDQIGSSEQFIWHAHSFGVTMQYGLETLGISVTDDGSELTIDGETYRDSDTDTSIRITVDGEPVEPDEHELSGASVAEARNGQGDDVRIEITTDES